MYFLAVSREYGDVMYRDYIGVRDYVLLFPTKNQ